MKKVVAVAPYNHGVNFKMQAYNAWVKMGGETMPSHYPWRPLHSFAFNCQLPLFRINKAVAQLRFVQPISLYFDTFPEYSHYEIIPIFWDSWPEFHGLISDFFVKYRVKTAIFCASQSADVMRKRFPNMNILTITEGIDTSAYNEGKLLKYRNIDLLEYGRSNRKIFNENFSDKIVHLYPQKKQHLFKTDFEFKKALCDAKIVISLPKHDTCPEETGFVETLTQRYWENMLSRNIMLGRAPKELIDLIGYNPVIELACNNQKEQVLQILNNVESYQELVDKNRSTALKMGDWKIRIMKIRTFLENCGYIF